MDTYGRESCSPDNPSPWCDDENGDEGTCEESFREKDPNSSANLQWLLELSEEDSECDLAAGAVDDGTGSYAETVRMFKLRRNLDQLERTHRQTEEEVLRAREQLKLCRQNLADIETQRETVEDKIEHPQEPKSSAAVFRLRAQHKRLCQELHREEELEARLSTALKARELELNRLEVELGRCSSLLQEVQEKERAFEALRDQRALARLQREDEVSRKVLQTRRRLGTQAAMHKKEGSKGQPFSEEAQAGHKKAATYLRETIKRMHQEEAEKEQKKQELLQKRTRAVKSLKDNIAATHESLKTQQNRDKGIAKRREQQENKLRESLQAQGINSTKHIYQQKQLEAFQQKKEEFEKRQESNRVEIMAKLQQEVQLAKRAAPVCRAAPTEALALVPGKAREKVLRYVDVDALLSMQERPTQRVFSDDSSSGSEGSDLGETAEEELGITESLVEPEFSGLWDQSGTKNVEEGTLVKLQPAEAKPAVPFQATKKCTRPTKRVLFCGKELKGPPFIGKPDVIHFKDFEVGKTYKKKVVLTNSSYTTNYCKLLGVSTQLMDFITISFDPPGAMSAGMACDMHAVFQPRVNRDLEGEVQFASDAGPFSLPIKCTTKKCDLEVDHRVIDFGTHVVGHTISWAITLINRGAKGTCFSLDTSTRLAPERSRSPPSPNTVQQEDGRESKSFANQKFISTRSTNDSQGPTDQNQEMSEISRPEQSAVSEASIPDSETAAGSCCSSGPGSAGEVPQGRPDPVMEQTDIDTPDISFGEVREGAIGPFDRVKLEVVFTPTIPGESELDFNINFSDETSEPIPIRARGTAVDVPVLLTRPSLDLKICMFDRLYQETIVVQSSASVSLGLRFEVCPEMRNHMEILPNMAVVQAKSSFSTQLKFLPRSTLREDAREFFDGDTGVLEVPLKVHVADQIQPISYTVHAVVTTSDLQFDCSQVDFGYCSTHESVRTNIRVTNLSLLPQDFGFPGIPEFVEVQPNDGFGTLLPLETLALELIFSAEKAKEYKFQLTCKTGINRDFPLPCRGLGVCPPAELSHNLVRFGATALGDCSTATLHLIHRTCKEPACSPGLAERWGVSAPAAGARLFSFATPEGSDVIIAPSEGRLLPREKCLVQVSFRPRLSEHQIREEAARLSNRSTILLRQETERSSGGRGAEAEEVRPESRKEKKRKGARAERSQSGARAALRSKNSKECVIPQSGEPPTLLGPTDIEVGSEQYEAGRASLLYSFSPRLQRYLVPCFLSDGELPPDDAQVDPPWSPHNTLYLELHCPAVQPPLVVISNNGQNTVDFHQVAVGQKVIHKLTVQNISKESLDVSFHKSNPHLVLFLFDPWSKLRSSILDPWGPFNVLNALRRISPGERHTLLLAFTPLQGKKYRETLQVRSPVTGLEVTLCGEGVEPLITHTPTDGPLDFDYVLVGDSASRAIQLQNTSSLAVRYRVLQASLCAPRPYSEEDCLPLLLHAQAQPTVGTQNLSGLCVFSATPAEGCIAAGESQDLTVTFQPDHQADNYSDRLTVELMNKTAVCVLDLKGAASLSTMYLYGGERLAVPTEDLPPKLATDRPHLPDPVPPEMPGTPVLLTLEAVVGAGGVVRRPAIQELEVGCVRTTQTLKKNGEFHWDHLTSLQERGFSVEPSKGTVEVGQRRTITVSWTPPGGHMPSELVEERATLTLKADETEVYHVTLMALATTDDAADGENITRTLTADQQLKATS